MATTQICTVCGTRVGRTARFCPVCTDVQTTRLERVRALQSWLGKDKKRYRRAQDPALRMREAAQFANDCTFANPAPDKLQDPGACERWAERWLANFAKAEAR